MTAKAGSATRRKRVLPLVVAALAVLAYVGWQKAHEDYVTGGVGYIQAAALRFDDAMDIRTRKAAFFAFLRPVIMAENRRIEMLRRNLLSARKAGVSPSWVRAMAADYRIAWTRTGTGTGTGTEWDALLRRVDTVPLLLALAQAANESNWGQSRFAQQGNNMFGQWCFKPGCGLVPERRTPGKKHEVAKYDTVNASVRSHLRNINTGAAYRLLRDLRRLARRQGRAPDAFHLAAGLGLYSERGADYVNDIRALIRDNRALMLGPEAGS